MMEAKTVNEVIKNLDLIIEQSKTEQSPMGYFAALYQKVTIKVKEKIEAKFFDDNERMEKLDVVFANRYLSAYSNYSNEHPITQSWKIALDATKNNRLIVLQHLLLGMNAHINLDLGIAAAQISDEANIESLKSDFDKINSILASLVDEVQKDLAEIWPTLTKILRFVKAIDDVLINFSMSLARDSAWDFAKKLTATDDSMKDQVINDKDIKVSELTRIISHPGIIVSFFLLFVRFGEKGKPSDKILALEEVIQKKLSVV